jgi:hypothetical protein
MGACCTPPSTERSLLRNDIARADTPPVFELAETRRGQLTPPGGGA